MIQLLQAISYISSTLGYEPDAYTVDDSKKLTSIHWWRTKVDDYLVRIVDIDEHAEDTEYNRFLVMVDADGMKPCTLRQQLYAIIGFCKIEDIKWATG